MLNLSGMGRWAALGATAHLVNRRREVERVPHELRAPWLYAPIDLPHRALVPLLQRLPAPPEVIPTQVTLARPVASTEDGESVQLFLYRPKVVTATPTGAIVWIHGGGHIFGTAAVDHQRCATMADELGVPVVNVEYRLAPQHPFPADLDDCFAGLRWLQDSAAELAVDPQRIAVAGASAGGGLAAALVQRAHDAGRGVAFQALVYPMLDDRTVLQRDHQGRGLFGWTADANKIAWQAYLGQPAGEPEAPAYAAPARRRDLAGLPPAWIGVGDLDLFHPEDLAYADRLSKAGVDCELEVVPGMYHAADIFKPAAASMVAFRERLTGALARALRRS